MHGSGLGVGVSTRTAFARSVGWAQARRGVTGAVHGAIRLALYVPAKRPARGAPPRTARSRRVEAPRVPHRTIPLLAISWTRRAVHTPRSAHSSGSGGSHRERARVCSGASCSGATACRSVASHHERSRPSACRVAAPSRVRVYALLAVNVRRGLASSGYGWTGAIHPLHHFREQRLPGFSQTTGCGPGVIFRSVGVSLL